MLESIWSSTSLFPVLLQDFSSCFRMDRVIKVAGWEHVYRAIFSWVHGFTPCFTSRHIQWWALDLFKAVPLHFSSHASKRSWALGSTLPLICSSRFLSLMQFRFSEFLLLLSFWTVCSLFVWILVNLQSYYSPLTVHICCSYSNHFIVVILI